MDERSSYNFENVDIHANVDTNTLVDRLTSIYMYITAANTAIIFRKSQIPSKRKCKKMPNWVNKICLLLRQEV